MIRGVLLDTFNFENLSFLFEAEIFFLLSMYT